MTTRILSAALLMAVSIPAQADLAALGGQLTKTYQAWRNAMVTKDARQWQALTADYRRREVQNRLVSEKRVFPAAVFEVPAPPPSLNGLRVMHVSQKGATAKVGYYGPVNFGVGGAPTENVLVLSFVSERGRWTYDRADFVNLAALPDVRKELSAGNPRYFKETPECQATGQIPPTAPAVPTAKYIAKAYVFCPGREVQLQVNRVSRHRFANAKEAEIILGGAKDGRNEVTFTAKPLEGSTGKEAMAIRVYLMSEIQGVKPIIAYEYLIKEGQPVKGFESGQFMLDPATAAKLVR